MGRTGIIIGSMTRKYIRTKPAPPQSRPWPEDKKLSADQLARGVNLSLPKYLRDALDTEVARRNDGMAVPVWTRSAIAAEWLVRGMEQPHQ